MAKIYGIKPQAEMQKLIGKFEDEVMVRHNNQQLVGTVYVDMNETRWAVAFAYNYTRNPGIHGHENPLEVRYSCPAQESSRVQMFRSDVLSEETLDIKPLTNGDDFIRFVLAQERTALGRTA